MEVNAGDVVQCAFYFSDTKTSKMRPVLVYKDNLPYDDFVGIPISGQTDKLNESEFIIDTDNFAEGGIIKASKIMPRKPFVISKNIVQKRYGKLDIATFARVHEVFCLYFGCSTTDK